MNKNKIKLIYMHAERERKRERERESFRVEGPSSRFITKETQQTKTHTRIKISIQDRKSGWWMQKQQD